MLHTQHEEWGGRIYMLRLLLWGIRIGRACWMIEFSRDKKTSVLICASPLLSPGPPGLLWLVLGSRSRPCSQIGGTSSDGREHFNRSGVKNVRLSFAK